MSIQYCQSIGGTKQFSRPDEKINIFKGIKILRPRLLDYTLFPISLRYDQYVSSIQIMPKNYSPL